MRVRRRARARSQAEAQAALKVVAQHAEAGRQAQVDAPNPQWQPPPMWSQPQQWPPAAAMEATPSQLMPPPVPISTALDVPTELFRVLEVVTTMCDHVIEYIEADRAERRLMIEALTKLAQTVSEQLPPPAVAVVGQSNGNGERERVIGGSMDAVPVSTIDLREPEQAVEVRCRFGDRWVDGFEICEVLKDHDGVRYRLRRRVDGFVLPELFDAADIRHVETFEELTSTPQQQRHWSPL